MQRYPFTAAAIASPTPVLPDVASTISPPGLRRPSRSAASIIATPIRSLTEPPGLKNSALAYSGVRSPWVTLFKRMSGVHPIVSRTSRYALMWACTRAPLQRVTLRVAKLDRLEECRGHGDAAASRWREPQPLRAADRRRIERGVAARLRHPRRLGDHPTGRVGEQPQHDIPFHFLVEQPGRILNRRVRVQGHRRLLVGRRRRPACRLIGRRRLLAAREDDEDERDPAHARRPHGTSPSPIPRPSFPSCCFQAARRLRASSGDSVFTSRPRSSASSGWGVPRRRRASWRASGGRGAGYGAT